MASEKVDFSVPSGKIIIVGDTRPKHPLEFILKGTGKQPKIVFDAIASEEPTAVFHLGDMVTLGSLRSSWNRSFTRYAKPVLDAGIPFFPVLGNHEYKPIYKWALEHYFERFPQVQGKRYYSVISGAAAFVILDSNFYAMKPGEAEKQDEWLEKTLSRFEKEKAVSFVAVLFHHPPFTNVMPRFFVGPDKDVRERWVPVLKKFSKVRAAFSGHIHTYERFLEGECWYIVTGGGGSPSFKLQPAERAPFKDAYEDKMRIRNFHYMRLTPSVEGMRFEMVEWNGYCWSVGESFVVKSNGHKSVAK